MLTFVVQVKLDQGTDWAAWVAAIASALTFGFVAVTAWLAWRGLRDARRTRHGQLIVEVSGLWDDQRVISSSRHFRSWGSDKTTQLVETLWAPGRETRYDLESDEGLADYETDLEDWYDLSIYPNLIDAIGVLSAEEALTVAVVDRMWGSNIIDAWARWKQPVVRLRELVDDTEVWWAFEDVAERLTSYRETLKLTRRARLSRWSRNRAGTAIRWLLLDPY